MQKRPHHFCVENHVENHESFFFSDFQPNSFLALSPWRLYRAEWDGHYCNSRTFQPFLL